MRIPQPVAPFLTFALLVAASVGFVPMAHAQAKAEPTRVAPDSSTIFEFSPSSENHGPTPDDEVGDLMGLFCELIDREVPARERALAAGERPCNKARLKKKGEESSSRADGLANDGPAIER